MDPGFSYHARSAHTGRRRLLLATALVVLLFILDLATGGAVRSTIRRGAADLSSVFSRTSAGISASGYFKSHAALAAQNAALKAQVAALQESAALAGALQAQVTALAGAARLAAALPGITAPVASSFISSPYGTFLIGAGSAQGVAAGNIVMTPEGIVIGTVSDVSAKTATVLQLSASGHVTPAVVDGSPISTSGKGGGNSTALVPNGITVHVGDAVTAPQFGDRVIGIVGHIDADPSSAAMTVDIGLPISLSSLTDVFVSPAH